MSTSFARKPAPKGWPRISSAAFHDDAERAIDWLCGVFGSVDQWSFMQRVRG